MANLIVRNIDEKIVDALKARAGKYGRSAEAEHLTITEQQTTSIYYKNQFENKLIFKLVISIFEQTAFYQVKAFRKH